MRICPNLSNPQVRDEFNELVSVLGENAAYYVWEQNNGYSLDYAPNGAQSKLFKDLYDYYKDRNKAITAKAKTFTDSFRQWFNGSKVVDSNNEPMVVYHGGPTGIGQFVNPKDLPKKYAGLHSTVLNRSNQMGIYFINKPKVAEQYAEAYRKNKQIYPVFISAKNIQNVKQAQFYGLQFLKNVNKLFNKDYINYQDITQEDVQKLKSQNIDALSTSSWSDSTEFVVFDPNQIKSIDNNGQYSLTDNNIYHYVKDNIKQASQSSYYSGKQGIGKLFTGKNQSAKQVLSNILNNKDFIDEGQIPLAQSLFDNLSDTVTVELVNDTNYIMAYQDGIVKVNIDAFNSYSNYDISNAFLHELLHHFTVNKYANDNSFSSKIDDLFNKVSEQFPKKEHPRKGLYYGLTSPQEFISELYVNSAFRDAVLKKNISLWKRILRTILNALKLNKLANKLISGNDVYKVYNAITDAINNRTLDPDLDNSGEIFFYKPDLDLRWLDDEAKRIIERAMNGLKASEKALRSRDKSPVQITKLQQDITRYQLMLQKGEDQEVLVDFIDRSSIQFGKVLNRIRKAILNPDILSNDDLKNFKNDFLDFYGPITESINEKLFFQGYFNNIPAKDLEIIKNQLNLINRAYQEIQGKYNYLLKQRIIDIFKEYGRKYNIPTDDLETFFNDKLNSSTKDINIISRYLQFASNSSDMGIRMVNRMITDINNQVQWFTNNKTQDLIRQFSNITKSEQLLYFEKDKSGKVTGYLVRSLNYGQFKSDYSEFLAQLDSKYGVVDHNYYLLDSENFANYCKEKEEWLEEHCERKFKNEYYREYNKLSQLARSKAKIFTEQISAIIQSVTDEDGPHLEKLSDTEWHRLDNLYSLKKNLSSDYYLDGSLKQGEDLDIAREFQRFYNAIGMGTIKSKQLSQTEILSLIHKKEKELSSELFEKWKQRNISIQYSDKFIELLKGLGKLDFKEDTDLYNKLYEERRQLLQLGRDNNLPLNIASKYQVQVKDRILELDKQISALRAKHSNGDKSFFDIADIIPTKEYERDKKIAKSKGKEEYNKWYNKHHYRDSRGNERIASYYTQLIPKDNKYYEYRLSRMNQELDKNSSMINPNYNFEDAEYYQPKKSLYDNSKAFEEATKTKEQKDIYKTIVDTMDEANSKISYMSKRDNYRLPQATGDFIDFTMRNGNFFKNFGSMIRDSIVTKNDDVEYALDNQITKADGSQLLLIPTHYVKMLEKPENISRNIVGLLSEYSRMAENFRLKNEYSSQFDIIQDLYDTRNFTRTNPIGTVVNNIEGSNSNTSNRLRDYLEMQLYGKTTNPWTFNLGKYSFSVTKLMNNLKKYASSSNLGNNFLSIAKSILQGFDKTFVEGFAGQFYTLSDLGKSLLRQIWRTPFRIFNIGNPKENDLSYALLEHNGIAHSTNEKVKGLQYNRGFRLFYKYLVWGGWQIADFMVKVPITESVYANFKYIPEIGKFVSFPQYNRMHSDQSISQNRKQFNKLNTFSMLDVYTVKDGKLHIKPEYQQYSEAINNKQLQQSLNNISSILCSRIDGQLQNEDKLMILQNAIGAAIGMHRSFFIVNANENLLKGYQYNPLIEDYDEAKYTSGFVGIGKYIYNATIDSTAPAVPIIK